MSADIDTFRCVACLRVKPKRDGKAVTPESVFEETRIYKDVKFVRVCQPCYRLLEIPSSADYRRTGT